LSTLKAEVHCVVSRLTEICRQSTLRTSTARSAICLSAGSTNPGNRRKRLSATFASETDCFAGQLPQLCRLSTPAMSSGLPRQFCKGALAKLLYLTQSSTLSVLATGKLEADSAQPNARNGPAEQLVQSDQLDNREVGDLVMPWPGTEVVVSPDQSCAFKFERWHPAK
jgi:hypothetical protein